LIDSSKEGKVMRMWMIDPKKLCRKHLLGEHVEIHMMVGSLIKGRSLDGFIERGILEPQNALSRHAELVTEMRSRGYNHTSPLPDHQCTIRGIVDKVKSEKDLVNRCPACAELITRNSRS
jgi:hypothetical protein